MPSCKIAALRPRHGMLYALAALSLLSSSLACAATTLLISGIPPTSGTIGQSYNFRPTAAGPSGHTLRFTIYDMPSWGTFNSATGQLSGTPKIPGTYSNIVLGVTDGISKVTLSPFNITISKSTGSTGLSISGTPPTSATVGSSYTFKPSATGPSGQALRFTIYDMPSWATFNSTTGQLAGTPTIPGTYSNIVLGVTNGTSRATLPAFSIVASSSGAALPPAALTISWMPPTENTDGTVLTNLAGYRIYYGTSQTSLTHVVNITNPGISSYVLSNLTAATWYFAVAAVNAGGVESPRSPVVSKLVQ